MVKNHFHTRPKQGPKKPMQRNKTLLRITLWFTIDFLPSSWMVHLLSSTGPFIEEISIHILSQEWYLMIFHCILNGVREVCRLTLSFVACFVSASSQACSWTIVLSRDQWARTVWHFLSSPFSSNFQQVQIHVGSGKKNKKIPVFLISHLEDRLHATQTAGLPHIAGNLFPIISSSVIRVYQNHGLSRGQSRRFYASRQKCDFGRALVKIEGGVMKIRRVLYSY